jgi:hypothetical protein
MLDELGAYAGNRDQRQRRIPACKTFTLPRHVGCMHTASASSQCDPNTTTLIDTCDSPRPTRRSPPSGTPSPTCLQPRPTTAVCLARMSPSVSHARASTHTGDHLYVGMAPLKPDTPLTVAQDISARSPIPDCTTETYPRQSLDARRSIDARRSLDVTASRQHRPAGRARRGVRGCGVERRAQATPAKEARSLLPLRRQQQPLRRQEAGRPPNLKPPFLFDWTQARRKWRRLGAEAYAAI